MRSRRVLLVALAAVVLMVASPGVSYAALTQQGWWGVRGTLPGQFQTPGSLDVAANGAVYVADSCRQGILVFSADGTFLFEWITFNSADQTNSFDPQQLVIGPDGIVYVTIGQGNLNGVHSSFVATYDLAGNRLPVNIGSLGTGPGQFVMTTGIAVDADGNIWVTDSNQLTVQKFAPDGTYLGVHWHYTGSPGAECYITIGPDGNVYLTETFYGTLQKYSPAGALLDQVSGLSYPSGLTFGPDDTLYVNEWGTDKVLHFTMALTPIDDSVAAAIPADDQLRGMTWGNGRLYTTEFGSGCRVRYFTEGGSGGAPYEVPLPGGGRIVFPDPPNGDVTITPSSGHDPNANFRIVRGGYYDISYTGTLTQPVTVYLPYDENDIRGEQGEHEEDLKLFHWKDNGWEDVTVSVDTANNLIVGSITSFSDFAIMVPDAAPPVVSTPASSPWSIGLLGVVSLGIALAAARSRTAARQ